MYVMAVDYWDTLAGECVLVYHSTLHHLWYILPFDRSCRAILPCGDIRYAANLPWKSFAHEVGSPPEAQ